jgi:[ribosomal protein S18]-alanine N-acetyltransferase
LRPSQGRTAHEPDSVVYSMAIHIRDASARDLLRIVEIEQLAFPTPWSLGAFRRELTLPFSRLTVAVSSEDRTAPPDGFLCRWLVADECHVLNVAVHPDHRRFGLGARLLGATIAEARQKSADVVTLEVRRSNLAARRLYRKFDFEERRLRRHYYGPGEDAIVMELRL